MLLEKNEIIFDGKKSLSALYLWLLFGFLSTMVSCDLQKWMVDNTFFRHVIGIIAFFFLFTVCQILSILFTVVINLWITCVDCFYLDAQCYIKYF